MRRQVSTIIASVRPLTTLCAMRRSVVLYYVKITMTFCRRDLPTARHLLFRFKANPGTMHAGYYLYVTSAPSSPLGPSPMLTFGAWRTG